MSDALKGRLPDDLENEAVAALEQNIVTAIVQVQIGNKKTAIVGILRSVLFENEPELELKVQLEEALTVVSAESLAFLGFELHHGERIIKTPGPFLVKGARIDEINPTDGMCVMSLGLKRSPKT